MLSLGKRRQASKVRHERKRKLVAKLHNHRRAKQLKAAAANIVRARWAARYHAATS